MEKDPEPGELLCSSTYYDMFKLRFKVQSSLRLMSVMKRSRSSIQIHGQGRLTGFLPKRYYMGVDKIM